MKECPGSFIIAGDGGFHVTDFAAGFGIHQGLQHSAGEPLAAGFGGDNDLPDENCIRSGRYAVAGDKAYDLVRVAVFGNDGGVREMRTLQKVAVDRVSVKRRTVRDELVDGKPVLGSGMLYGYIDNLKIAVDIDLGSSGFLRKFVKAKKMKRLPDEQKVKAGVIKLIGF